jgi:hypothetical protein
MSTDAKNSAIKAFMFRTPESEELFKAVLMTCDLGLQIEMGKVMASNVTPDQRTHSAGRLDAINDLLLEFQKLREEAKTHMV